MKTVVCGLGKCGSRMVLDLNALVYGGKYSCQLRVPKDSDPTFITTGKGLFKRFMELFEDTPKLFSEMFSDDEVPAMHMGDSDGQNEVLNMCTVESGDKKDEERRKRLQKGVILFNNYHDACGQYHIIGEEVMRNLFATDSAVSPQIIDKYII